MSNSKTQQSDEALRRVNRKFDLLESLIVANIILLIILLFI